MKAYLKDIARTLFASLGASGVVLQTSDWTTRILVGVLIIVLLILSFLLDSKDPRTHNRAAKILLQSEDIGHKILALSELNPSLNKIAQGVKADVAVAQQGAQNAKSDVVGLEDLVSTKLAPDAVAAPNGIPPAA